MDLVICEAPLDNSFQKEKLELVNKGSLGRRRKPSRANLKLLLSPAADSPQTPRHLPPSAPANNTTQSALSKPTCAVAKVVVNGIKERNLSRQAKKEIKFESSLPRTSTEPNYYVNEAQQFTIEAKLKRRKSDSGRSAVLIQTWERRTRCDSFSRQSKPKNISRTQNRFQNKENLGCSVVMPDSHAACPKYNGNFENGQWSKDGGFVASVRDGYSNGAMVYRNATNGLNCETANQTNLNHHKPAEEEPEWISISRKLRAKFVEGHIEQNSVDSYLHEEPEGDKLTVQKKPFECLQQPKNRKLQPPTRQEPPKVEKKVKVIVDTSEARSPSGEPPWIQLSRKLCTKFIEEHIEYPVVSNVPVREAADLLECNGDVRIIEKIGKPKERKSKIRKESEPEWVSLSKKLRAKFIESHIDDPDTISLDNQLNASDPEETSSESLSDTSPEISLCKKTYNEPKTRERKNVNENKEILQNGNSVTNYSYKERNGVPFTEKECCWEYQEMEFDQESNLESLQEPEIFEENPFEPNGNHFITNDRYIESDTKKFESNVQVYSNGMSFVESINCEPFYNAECYNNDVRFAPHITETSNTETSKAFKKDSAFEKKYITVQFVAHPDKSIPEVVESEDTNLKSSPSDAVARNGNSDFFNISTWEEARYKSDDSDSDKNLHPGDQVNLPKNFKSKSMDNLCDVDGKNFPESVTFNVKRKVGKVTTPLSTAFSLSKSETVLDQIESENIINNAFNNLNDFENNISNGEFDGIRISKNEIEYSDAEDLSDHSGENQCVKTFEKSNSNSRDIEEDQQSIEHKKKAKCNGVIPNSRKKSEDDKRKENHNKNLYSERKNNQRQYQEEIIQSKSKQMYEPVCQNEYANINPLANMKASMNADSYDSSKLKNKSKSTQSICKKMSDENIHSNRKQDYASVIKHSKESNAINSHYRNGGYNINCDKNNISDTDVQLGMKSMSLCDISKHKEFPNSSDESSIGKTERRKMEKGISQYEIDKPKNFPELKFQHFKSEADIPLCAKLVKQNGKYSVSSMSSSSNRNTSPCSESSHVYEDMFKETTSCPSDSETSSWTVMKNNSYYINGRSSSMNDLDYSDSCSLSVKCDYASSCSEQSTLQSRHSSCTSSSFYVNLRDYDSHMLEPSLNRRKDHRKKTSNGNSSKLINSNPPTPESLRHLFTSPFNSTPNRGNRLLNKLPSEPEIHYYSTASAASSAFKHGFEPTPQKPKKTERSSSIKIKDIAHGIILTFRKFQNHSKNSHVSSTHYVDVSHLAESGSKSTNSDSNKPKSKKDHSRKHEKKGLWGFQFENGKTDSDSGCHLSASEMQKAKARRSSSDLTGIKPRLSPLNQNTIISENIITSEKKKIKNGKKNSNAREKGKKSRSKSMESKTIPTVSRKIQQMADGTLCLVTTVSGDTALPGVYSDSPDTSSELSTHRPVKPSGESNC